MPIDTLELDDLKQAWAQLERRQDMLDTRLREDHHDRRRRRASASTRRSLALLALELIAWMLFVAWAASFWVEHRHTQHLLVIGAVLHVYGVAAIWSTATQLLFTARVHLFDAPVTVLQARLARLRRLRFYSTLLLGLPWWWLWLLMPLAALVSVAGVDLYAAASGWIWASLAAGTAGIAASLGLARHLSKRTLRSPLLQRIVDDMSGRSLLAASRALDDIARFENV